ncbi:MAG: hypothetical protein Roseis2KO_47500 [Roseivirga sp.]
MIREGYSGTELELTGNQYFLRSTWPERKDTVIISDQDLLQVKNALVDIFQKEGDEYWSVSCIADGFHLKLYLKQGNKQKKIYIGNYFDLRYNKIALILNRNLPENPEYYYRLPYGITDPDEIERALKKSENNPELYPECQAPEHIVEEAMNVWCEG